MVFVNYTSAKVKKDFKKEVIKIFFCISNTSSILFFNVSNWIFIYWESIIAFFFKWLANFSNTSYWIDIFIFSQNLHSTVFCIFIYRCTTFLFYINLASWQFVCFPSFLSSSTKSEISMAPRFMVLQGVTSRKLQFLNQSF